VTPFREIKPDTLVEKALYFSGFFMNKEKELMALVMGIVVAAVAWQRRSERRKAREMKREMKKRRKKHR
jgi:hypothetical protein